MSHQSAEKCIVAINPGSTSTKVGVFFKDSEARTTSIAHSDRELSFFDSVVDQLEYRSEKVRDALSQLDVSISDIEAVVGRGGLLKPLESGTYAVNGRMKDDLKAEARGSHASNLGALIAAAIAKAAKCRAFIVDPVSVDEYEPVARYSGFAELERTSLSHALNTKAVAKRYAADCNRAYDDLRLLVVHLGSGITVSAHVGGRMIDVNNSREEGAMAPDRAGTVPAMALLDLCYSGSYDKKELGRKLFSNGGVHSYLGTKDMQRAVEMIESGNEKAKEVINAMVYQIAKDIGAMASVLEGRLDQIIVTGGIAHNTYILERLLQKIEWIGPITTYPGEDELQALAEGARRVLDDSELALEYA